MAADLIDDLLINQIDILRKKSLIEPESITSSINLVALISDGSIPTEFDRRSDRCI